MVSFQQFCNQHASGEWITDQLDTASFEFSKEYDMPTRIRSMIEIMKPKVNIVDKINVPLIESASADISEVESKLKDFNNGDIPDCILVELSNGLYGESDQPFTSLTIDQQNIIKILAVYICISAMDK